MDKDRYSLHISEDPDFILYNGACLYKTNETTLSGEVLDSTEYTLLTGLKSLRF